MMGGYDRGGGITKIKIYEALVKRASLTTVRREISACSAR